MRHGRIAVAVAPGAAALVIATLSYACAPFGETDLASSPDAANADGRTLDHAGLDSGASDGAIEDATRAPIPVGVRCPIGAAFGAPIAVPVPGDFSIESVRFTPDQTKAYLALCPADGTASACNLFASVILGGGGFGAPDRLAVSAEGAFDSAPFVASDGARLLFTSSRSGTARLYSAEDVGAGFVNPLLLALPPAMNLAVDAYLVRKTNALYFAAKPSGGEDWDLFRSTGTPPLYGAGSAVLLSNLTNDVELAPVVTEDELEIFWASGRTDPARVGGLDLWSAKRVTTDPTYRYGTEAIMSAQSGAGDDYPTWISPDACDLYMIRKTGPNGRLFVAHRK